MNFGKLQLNTEAAKRLSAAVDTGMLSHAVLLTGGTSKERKELSILLSQAMLCQNQPKPCLKCDSCKKIKSGIHPDIIITEGEAGKQKSIKIETIRDIRNKAYIMPNEAQYQVFIILEASGMGEEAQNALLKILEEPPATARFILASRSRDDFRQTILSRVTPFAISEDSGIAAGEKENAKAVKAADAILTAILLKSEYKIMLAAGQIEKDRKNFKATCEKLILLLHGGAICKYNSQKAQNPLEMRVAKEFTVGQIATMQDILKKLIADADKNANDNLLLTRLSKELGDIL